MFQKGYTTKGKGRGMGLYWVQCILKEKEELIHETNLKGNMIFQKIDISEIIPVYIVELIDGQNTDHMPGLKYTAKPFYLFLVDEKYEVGDSISISRQNSYRYYYLVDMVTGEFTTNMKN